MRRLLFILLGAAVVLSPVWVTGETGFTNVSVTATSGTTTFTTAQSTVMLCSYGANDAFFRLFTTEDTAAAATTAQTKLVAGSATDPKCMSFTHNPRTQKGLGWGAVSLICAAAETATVHLITE